MEREEILKESSKKKALVGEMENVKISKANWIAIICAGVLAVAFMIVEGALGHYQAIFAIGGVCNSWASVFYFCQYFLAKRPFGVMVGGILHGLGFVAMIVLYVISSVYAW